MKKVTESLAKALVQDESGASRPLETAWQEKTAVVAFVRHFGCLLCREQVSKLRDSIPAMEAKGAHLVVVGNGAPRFIESFRKTTGFQGTIWTDPTLAVYKAASFTRGVRAFLDPRAALSGIRALCGGYHTG